MLKRAVPVFAVLSLDKSVAFYEEKLGFHVRHRDGGFAIVERDDVTFHLTQLDDESWRTRADFKERPIDSGAESFLPGTQMCRVEVADAKALFDEMEPKGVLHPRATLTDQPWGNRDFGVLDVDRNLIIFFQRLTLTPSRP